jgi:hypothetical protein
MLPAYDQVYELVYFAILPQGELLAAALLSKASLSTFLITYAIGSTERITLFLIQPHDCSLSTVSVTFTWCEVR